MKVIILDRNRSIYEADVSVATIQNELQTLAYPVGTTAVTMTSGAFTPVAGVTAIWAPQESLHPVALAGLGPCAPPVYFVSSDQVSDLTLRQVEQLVQQLNALPGVVNRMQPQQLDPSVRTGEADPVGIIPGNPSHN